MSPAGLTVVDTNVWINSRRGVAFAKQALFAERASGHLATTTITVFELMSGARTPSERQAWSELLGECATVYGLSVSAAEYAANIRLDLEARGQRLDTADLLIAGIVLAHGARLITFDNHFSRITALVGRTQLLVLPPR
jgi:predicted nucleic acid-binding protein